MVHPDYQRLTPEAAQARGQMHFSVHQYDLALEAFSAAFELSGGKSIGILDNRVATYEKLAHWTAAYQDASLMMSLKPDDPRHKGYLRAGKILCRTGKQNSAARIYGYGVDHANQRDPQYPILRSMANRVPRTLAIPKGKLVDPFVVLPIELGSMVAELISFNTLVLCLRVSKRWNRFLSSLSHLWRDLNLSAARRTVGEKFVMSCIRRSRGTLTRASLQFLTDDEDSLKAILSRIALRCKNLNHLEIRDAGSNLGIIDTIPMAQNLNTLILHSTMRFEVSSMLLRNCPNLVHVEFHKLQCFSRHPDPWPKNLERIRKLDLRQCLVNLELTSHALILQRLLDRTSNLRELTLVGWRNVPATISNDYSKLDQLESLSIVDCDVNNFPLLPPTIRYLKIGPDLGLRTQTPAILANIMANDLSQLESLVLKEIFFVGLVDILSMLRNSSSLKILHISRCLKATNVDLVQILTSDSTKNVIDLALVDTLGIDDEVIRAISDMRHLQFLDLSGNLTLDGVGVKQLISKSGTILNKLRLKGCKNVGHDAVDRARQIGIDVDFEAADWDYRHKDRFRRRRC
ncbi:MAG: hypothetical protein M1839_008844 [Geoglossum umbratile]|nr:MAG: hypothetical protein M1839_008844 [Geoglossum umbratile]